LTEAVASEARSLRVFSANLLLGRADGGALSELLAELDPDVVALQEFAPQHEAAVRDLLPHGEAPTRESPMMALALRHPAAVERVPGAPRNVYRARLEPGAWPTLPASLEVLASHINAPHQLPPWRTFSTRRAQVRALLRHIEQEPALPRILVGDLNATPRWPAYLHLCRALEDAAIVAAQQQGRAPAATWAPRPAGPRWLRIDHALVRGVSVKSLQVVSIRGSDHAGLVVDLGPAAKEG